MNPILLLVKFMFYSREPILFYPSKQNNREDESDWGWGFKRPSLPVLGFPKCWDLHSLTFAKKQLPFSTWPQNDGFLIGWIQKIPTSPYKSNKSELEKTVTSDSWFFLENVDQCSQWPVNIGECWGEIMKNPNGFLDAGAVAIMFHCQ